MSYSIYLWHWGVISISRWTIGIHWWSIPFLVICIFFIAKISTNLSKNRFDIRSFFLSDTWHLERVEYYTLASIQSLSFLSFQKMYTGSRINLEDLSENPKSKRSCDNKSFQFLFVGDSHAGHFLPAKKHACDSYDINIDALWTGGPLSQLLFTRIHFTALVLQRKIVLWHLQR